VCEKESLPTSTAAALRFALAATALSPLLLKVRTRLPQESPSCALSAGRAKSSRNGGQARWEAVLSGLEIGAWVAMGYLAQGIGLETSSSGHAAFLCSLSVVVCPILAAIEARLHPDAARAPGPKPAVLWASVGLALAGVGLLELGGDGAPVVGDLWLLVQPLGYGMGFHRTEAALRRFPDQAGPLTAMQVPTHHQPTPPPHHHPRCWRLEPARDGGPRAVPCMCGE
jgi:drug/metabolite transporter (DMT)-like permease